MTCRCLPGTWRHGKLGNLPVVDIWPLGEVFPCSWWFCAWEKSSGRWENRNPSSRKLSTCAEASCSVLPAYPRSSFCPFDRIPHSISLALLSCCNFHWPWWFGDVLRLFRVIFKVVLRALMIPEFFRGNFHPAPKSRWSSIPRWPCIKTQDLSLIF